MLDALPFRQCCSQCCRVCEGEKSLLQLLREADSGKPVEGRSLGRGLVRLAHLAAAVHQNEMLANLDASDDSLLKPASSGA